MTLSHRWQNENVPKLLTSNLHAFLEAIELNTLPAVFLDAIDLCRRMNVPFLWIDALCLIQNDPVDCAREILSMGEIHANACTHVGAATASNVPGSGLYTEVDPIGLGPIHVDFLWDTRRFSRILHEDTAAKRINTSELMSRGWVLQQRLLSSRSVYLDDLISWKCAQLVTTELHPQGTLLPTVPTSWGYALPFKLPYLLKQSNLYTDPKTVAFLYQTSTEGGVRLSRSELSQQQPRREPCTAVCLPITSATVRAYTEAVQCLT